MGDRLNQWLGKTRFVVSRVFIHLSGSGATPLLGILNPVCQRAIAADGDLDALGEGLVEVCQGAIEYRDYWRSVTNEGDVFWDEGEAGDCFNTWFVDAAGRYLSQPSEADETETSMTPNPTEHLVVMLAFAYEGESPDLETDLADFEALQAGLKALMTLHYNQQLRAIQVHFSPARFGDTLTADDVLEHYPELVPI